jgi:hypothetical protein
MNTFSRVAIVLIGMTSVAVAQPKAADNKMVPAAKAADTKPADMTPADAKAGGAMPEMTPPKELADMAKASAGTWTCKGQGADHTMKMADMTGKMKIALSADKWWLQASFDSKMGKDPFHFESFTMYDAATKKWKRVMVESGGVWSNGESAGMKDNKIDWDLTAHMGTGDAMFRDHTDLSDAKAGAKMSGEMSLDKGKNWIPVYSMSCKK